MEAWGATRRRPGRTLWTVGALVCLGVALQGCGLYNDLMRYGGSLPLGDGGAEWSPAVTTPTGGAFGVQIIQRF